MNSLCLEGRSRFNKKLPSFVYSVCVVYSEDIFDQFDFYVLLRFMDASNVKYADNLRLGLFPLSRLAT